MSNRAQYHVRAVRCDHRAGDEEVYRALKRATDPLESAWQKIRKARRITLFAPHAPPFVGQRCTAIHRELWVLPNGDVSPCAHFTDLVMGNACREGTMAVWNGPAFRRFRRHLARRLMPACVRCPKLNYTSPPRESLTM